MKKTRFSKVKLSRSVGTASLGKVMANADSLTVRVRSSEKDVYPGNGTILKKFSRDSAKVKDEPIYTKIVSKDIIIDSETDEDE